MRLLGSRVMAKLASELGLSTSWVLLPLLARLIPPFSPPARPPSLPFCVTSSTQSVRRIKSKRVHSAVEMASGCSIYEVSPAATYGHRKLVLSSQGPHNRTLANGLYSNTRWGDMLLSRVDV
ncbi:uncharacterized protein EV420DRAFT_1600383 [Desarmillaria tabescens]|uniref:Uncharacterized protein n=1 Tax=Armillaria tabescens TaxID=1929756 RepID=A0AA39J0R8_ARMTA|nr:uncharacterized protein EV420DRAFT_1600383 [Desarmillaria tabescens]KAK0433395.1 hypothetical protein EV420DRAFT_1600383 [Desarmillaria tabescens]